MALLGPPLGDRTGSPNRSAIHVAPCKGDWGNVPKVPLCAIRLRTEGVGVCLPFRVTAVPKHTFLGLAYLHTLGWLTWGQCRHIIIYTIHGVSGVCCLSLPQLSELFFGRGHGWLFYHPGLLYHLHVRGHMKRSHKSLVTSMMFVLV